MSTPTNLLRAIELQLSEVGAVCADLTEAVFEIRAATAEAGFSGEIPDAGRLLVYLGATEDQLRAFYRDLLETARAAAGINAATEPAADGQDGADEEDASL